MNSTAFLIKNVQIEQCGVNDCWEASKIFKKKIMEKSCLLFDIIWIKITANVCVKLCHYLTKYEETKSTYDSIFRFVIFCTR